jgi:murein DD-endopeptidase MepM/ murein hydrolase activator NlpD
VDLELFPKKVGEPYRLRANLKLKDHTFRKQELSLPVEMVDLSKKNLDKVQTDNISIKDISSNRIQHRYWSKPFMLPVRGRISTYFGTTRMMNGKPRSPHSGLDIAAGRGKTVAVSNKGVVTLARNMLLTGNTVMVDHGWGIYTLYAHLEEVFVKEGQILVRGETLGSVGSTGRATGPHLHFGAFIRGAKVDPLKLIEATAVLNSE